MFLKTLLRGARWPLLTLVVALGLSFIDWRPARPAAEPRLLQAFLVNGPLQLGAAKVELVPGLPTVVAGYPLPRREVGSSGPLFARALVASSEGRSVGLVLAELLLIPDAVARAVREKGRALGLDAVVVAATHTHSAFGGYDPNPLAQLAGVGRHDAQRTDWLVERLVEALRQAKAGERPATLRSGTTALENVSLNRAVRDGPVESALDALEAVDGEGVLIARIFLFGAHPTLVGRGTGSLDGDFPGRAMQRLEAGGTVAFALQGALGDVSARPPPGPLPAPDAMAVEVEEAVRRALEQSTASASALGVASVEVALPQARVDAAVPAWLRVPAANLLTLVAPRTAGVDAVRLGGWLLLAMPGEPTVEVARALVADALAAADGTVRPLPVALAQGYVGYIETAERIRENSGEAKRTLFGPELAERIGGGLKTAVRALGAAGE